MFSSTAASFQEILVSNSKALGPKRLKEKKYTHIMSKVYCQSCSPRSSSSQLARSHYPGHSVPFDSSCSCQKKTQCSLILSALTPKH